MKKDPRIFLGHILDCVADIEEYVETISQHDFLHDKKTQDATMRKLQIIGEAVKNLPLPFRKKHTEIDWKEIAGMRDILIHEYFGIHLKIVWTTIKKDLPKLKKAILELVSSFDEKSLQLRIK